MLLLNTLRAAARPKHTFQMTKGLDEMAHVRRARDRLRRRWFFGHPMISLTDNARRSSRVALPVGSARLPSLSRDAVVA